jgi:hypothetical protein
LKNSSTMSSSSPGKMHTSDITKGEVCKTWSETCALLQGGAAVQSGHCDCCAGLPLSAAFVG